MVFDKSVHWIWTIPNLVIPAGIALYSFACSLLDFAKKAFNFAFEGIILHSLAIAATVTYSALTAVASVAMFFTRLTATAIWGFNNESQEDLTQDSDYDIYSADQYPAADQAIGSSNSRSPASQWFVHEIDNTSTITIEEIDDEAEESMQPSFN